MPYQYYDFVNACFVAVSVVILVSSVDDFFIDLCYWGRTIYRWLFVRRKYKPLEIETLRQNPEKRIAIMIPAWDEVDVIAKMLETSIHFIEYEKYAFFVGVYPNDRRSAAELDRTIEKHPNVRKVLLPHDGPTCKADCLNWIIRTIFLHEERARVTFDAFVMDDSEAQSAWNAYAGAGVHFHRWYREDKYNAPRSYLDVVAQYRFDISGDGDDRFVLTLLHSF